MLTVLPALMLFPLLLPTITFTDAATDSTLLLLLSLILLFPRKSSPELAPDPRKSSPELAPVPRKSSPELATDHR